MWLAVFDFQHERDRPEFSDRMEKHDKTYDKTKGDDKFFMRNPTLYKIGMTNSCFHPKLFVQWCVYAIIHAIWVYYINFYSLNLFAFGWNSPVDSDGN